MISNFYKNNLWSGFTALVIIAFLFGSCNRQGKKNNYSPKAIELNNRAVKYMQSFKDDSVLIFFDESIALDENYYFPHVSKASIFIKRKQFDKALFESEMVIKKKPDFAEGWVMAGMLYDHVGDTITAKKYYKTSIEIYSERIENNDNVGMLSSIRLNRALSYILLGQKEKGKSEMRLLKKEEPENLIIDKMLNIGKAEYIKQILGD